MPNVQNEITRLFINLNSGNRAAIDALMPLIYEKLRAMAQQQLLGKRAGAIGGRRGRGSAANSRVSINVFRQKQKQAAPLA